ncbi:MAG: ribosome hibernation-promoting factor, HPF/YfiA family [Candidatus Paceibacteria bacterium]
MELKIKVTGAVMLTDELRAHIEKKVQKLRVFLKNDSTAIVEIEVGTTSTGQRTGDVFRGEVHATWGGQDAYAEAVHATLHGALDEAVKEARRELRKRKGKNRDLMRRGAVQVKEFFRNFGK